VTVCPPGRKENQRIIHLQETTSIVGKPNPENSRNPIALTGFTTRAREVVMPCAVNSRSACVDSGAHQGGLPASRAPIAIRRWRHGNLFRL
jgi:hypothetical protein